MPPLAENRGFILNFSTKGGKSRLLNSSFGILSKQKPSFRRLIVVYFTVEYRPISFTNAQMLARNRAADNRMFTEMFRNTEFIKIFRRKHFMPDTTKTVIFDEFEESTSSGL